MTTMNDEHGCSTCTAPGTEKYEKFTTRVGRKVITRIQYDYRHTDGELFTTVAPTIKAARLKRDAWLDKKGGEG